MKEVVNEYGTWREPDCAYEWLELAHDIAIDYDGCETTDGLKSLIDEMVEYIDAAVSCIKQEKLYSE